MVECGDNETDGGNSTVTEAIMPNKTAALAYLDGEGPAPPKFARVVVSVGAAEEAYLEDLMV